MGPQRKGCEGEGHLIVQGTWGCQGIGRRANSLFRFSFVIDCACCLLACPYGRGGGYQILQSSINIYGKGKVMEKGGEEKVGGGQLRREGGDVSGFYFKIPFDCTYLLSMGRQEEEAGRGRNNAISSHFHPSWDGGGGWWWWGVPAPIRLALGLAN